MAIERRHLHHGWTWLAALFAGQPALAVQPPGPGAAADWLAPGGDAAESGYSRLAQITGANAGRLGLAWSLELPNEGPLESTPLAVDGTLYFTGGHAEVYAVNGVTGELLWKYDPQTWKIAPARLNFAVAPVNRGAAYAGGRIFAATIDGRLFALDARTGKLLWSVQTLPEQGYYTSTGAPRTFAGKVIIGNGGGDIGMRGYVTAYDQVTGKQVWRFYTAPGITRNR